MKIKKFKHSRKFSEDEIKETAQGFNSRKSFNEACPRMYYQAKKIPGLLDDLFGEKWKKKRKYTIEIIKELAKEFERKQDFRLKYPNAYAAAHSQKWIDEIFPYKELRFKSKFTKEYCRELASGCSTRSEFYRKYSGASKQMSKMGWEDELLSHCKKIEGSIPQKICKYIFDILFNSNGKFNDRSIITPFELDIYYPELLFAIEYDGYRWHSLRSIKIDKTEECKKKGIYLLTIKESEKDSKNYFNSIKVMIINNLDKINNTLNIDIKIETVMQIELDPVKFYKKIENYSDQYLSECVNKCSSLKEFMKKYGAEYRYIKKMKKIELLIPIKKIFKRAKLSNEYLAEVASEYTDYNAFAKKHGNDIAVMRNRGLFKQLTAHMVRKTKEKPRITNRYTVELLIEIMKKFKSRNAFHLEHPGAYKRAAAMGLLDQFLPVMQGGPLSKYNELVIRELASKCKNKYEFSRKHNAAMVQAKKLGIWNELF